MRRLAHRLRSPPADRARRHQPADLARGRGSTSITLKILHDIVQAAMGWFDFHLWEFWAGGRTYGLPMDEDWGTQPRQEAAKVRLGEVFKPGKTLLGYT